MFPRAGQLPRRRRRLPATRRHAAELPAVPNGRRRRRRTSRSRCRRRRATVEADGYPLHAARQPAAEARSRPAFLDDRRHRPAREAGALHAVVRRARARDLLPRGHARLLPHARLRARRERLHELPRRRAGRGQLDDAGKAARRRSRSRRRNVAAVPADAASTAASSRLLSPWRSNETSALVSRCSSRSAALAFAAVASAHAHVSPPIVARRARARCSRSPCRRRRRTRRRRRSS